MINLNLIIPEIFACLTIMFLLLLGVFKKNSSNLVYNLTILSLFILLTLVLNLSNVQEEYVFAQSYRVDNLSTFMKILTIVSAIFVMLTSS